MTSAIETRSVTQRFGGLVAVDDVTLSVAQGTVHGVIGPNGAGKTTLLNVLSGLQRPTAGSVVVGGHDVTRWRGHHYVTKARLVRTFQTVRLFSSMTVRENVTVAARTVARTSEARERVERVLDRLDLTPLADEPATSLSYGTQRRVELARVLVAEPSVVLLDEPAAGLSPHERSELAALLRQMRDDGVTIVLVEHHMDLVHAVCEAVTVLDFGKVISRGTAQEVTEDERVLEAYLGGKHHKATAVGVVDQEDPL
ncbi:MAG TPA: ABC transporter ATP-binding protein [Marmoricola sp.]|jgi:branched-chain amino acid transport system ATP-binding protein|nr:ABC transporter ATP-binding protein [Marmoricola sp.]